MKTLLTSITVICVALLSFASSQDNTIAYPEDYKSYTNYISSDRLQNPDQTIRIFANDIAMKGPGKDGKFPYGSILVAEVYKAKKDEEGNVLTSSLNRRLRGDLAVIAVMQREQGFIDNAPEGLKTGDWDFAAFKPDGSDAGKDLNTCRACHIPLTDTNFVFSYEHLKK